MSTDQSIIPPSDTVLRQHTTRRLGACQAAGTRLRGWINRDRSSRTPQGRPAGRSAGHQWHERGAEIGRCAARGWWFYGLKLVLTATLYLLPDRAALVPAAADEREAAAALLAPGAVLIGDRNFGRHAAPSWEADLDRAGAAVIAPPPRRRAAGQDPAERAFLRAVRNRIETLIGLLKGEHGLENHGARSWWGLLTRLVGLLAAFTLAHYCLHFGLA